MKRYLHHLPTFIAVIAAIAGTLAVLHAWQLPPFTSSIVRTENAYVRGHVAAIAPQLSGHIVEVPVRDFAEVEAGDVLVRIDDRIYRQRLAQAEAALDGARAQLDNSEQSIHAAEAGVQVQRAAVAAAEASLQTAQSDTERNTSLETRGVISSSNADQSRLALEQAKAQLAQSRAQLAVAEENVKSATVQRGSLEAAVNSARATVELARLDVENTIIRAPVAGRLGQVSAQVGQYVSAGTQLVSLVPPDVWIIANVKETDLHGMATGQSVRIDVDALDGEQFAGHIESFSPAAASEFSLLSASNATGNFIKITQRVPVRIAIDADQPESKKLAPGMSVVVSVNRSG
jgi:multidrug resistance efflux pump